jgi:hypothetical protein
MKRITIFLISCILLTACNNPTSSTNPTSITNRNTIIDWVDFIKINGTQYEVINSAIITDYSYIGKKIGEVDFKVADNVSNPKYQIKNGDAAFWEPGTEIFEVLNMPELIAVPDEDEINGFRIYHEESVQRDYKQHFKDLDLDIVKKVEFYKGDNKPHVLNTLNNKEEITEFFALIGNGETNSEFNPDISHGEPEYYQMVFYSDEQIAYKFNLFFDSKVWFWHPWDTSIVSKEIERFVRPVK